MNGGLTFRMSEVVLDGERVSGEARLGFLIPLSTVNPLNNREHRMARHRRVLRERNAVALCWPRVQVRVPCAVQLTRVAPARNQLDDDGCTAAMKTVRDELARLIGVDDRDPRVIWTTSAAVGPWGVRVSIAYKVDGEALPERPRPSPRRKPARASTPRMLSRAQATAGFKLVPNFIPPRKP